MDDSCAVCAETLEWVAYGACGHRDVCSTCVARLRFICDDHRCCICKTVSDLVFVTKALGDYTRMINDFKVLPLDPKEGKVGESYWYHEDTQAFFDDPDHYKMIKAMCRLSCSMCDNMEEGNAGVGAKRRPLRFRNVDQLKGHLFHKHRLLMCSLCLEGRKVFICEQKLYTRAQLNQHISTGDSEVDGHENERGGFTGHPMCEFCKTPFYGDNELYTHMSTEHYTCHICQRQHPGQYEYYKNYDDLEIHFRRDHFLCEDESCLSKKFVVFQTEAEMKRHNALEHGGHMSRSQRNAALQIPTSFRYRHYEQDQRRGRGRGRGFRRDQSDDQLSVAIQASLEAANLQGVSNDPSSSNAPAGFDTGAADVFVDPIVQPFESLAVTDSETAARYLQALGQGGGNAPFGESSFPPLASSSEQLTHRESEGLPKNTMAERLRGQRTTVTVAYRAPQQRPAANRANISSSSTENRPALGAQLQASQSSASVPSQSSFPRLPKVQVHPAVTQGNLASGSSVPPSSSFPSLSHVQSRPTVAQASLASGFSVRPSSSFAKLSQGQAQGDLASGSSGKMGKTTRVSHSASFPNLADSESRSSNMDFPPISAVQVRKAAPSNQASEKVGDVQTANKSLVEKLRAALEHDEDKYASFKAITAQYRQDSVDTEKYLEYVKQYGLSHLVLDLARLCPDTQKQKELIDTFNASLRSNVPQENGRGQVSVQSKNHNRPAKGKGIASEEGNSKNNLADDIMSSVRSLQSNHKPVEDVEVLSKDGYRSRKGKSVVIADQEQMELRAQNDSVSASDDSNKKAMDSNGGSKKGKKTSKFHRVRLGDGSMAALWDLRNSGRDPEPEPDPDQADKKSEDTTDNPTVGLPVRGVWRKGGGQKLFS